LESGETPSSPGQLASHYAPGKKVVVVEDPATFTIREGHQCCIMLPAKGLQDWDRLASSPAVVSSMVLAPETGSLEESAARLFSVLRELDKGPGDVMLVPSFAEGGLGAALMDRLRRAAAHR
jgi:L-threonylcarbamoyladenylate synthase